MPFPGFDIAEYSTPEFTRYAAIHEQTNGAGDARPTALQIVEDNDLEGKLDSKVILITGCSSGIGIETARALKTTGAHIFCTARSLSKGQKALADILEPGKVDLLHLDLNSLASVRQFAAEFLKAGGGKLNILINNAGVMATPEGKTEDGFEMQFGTNHLSHFLLFQLLKPALLSSSTPDFNSRVVSLSSSGHRYFPPKMENITSEYDANRAYAHSKTANIWFANEVDRKYGSQGLHALSLHPGGIWTGLMDYIPPEQLALWKQTPAISKIMKSVEQGAATTVWAAIGKAWEGKGGRYLEDCQVSSPVTEGYQVMDRGYEKWAYDPENEAKLWKMSNEYVGFKEE
ncbi:NAD(P)-binding protein [Cucurbitaria berberidis CBS 394.84]|uniref:NAD(P)-binding protein n=1 Tax=Cucurbitaria berberidis CBS 394.84 TaxID=1168544 RepID=A0A9P4G8N1_9PLEO|nr:NAD(P)-binding protein [Cucurbitaria berberidis CBS 394.84]KAF1841082.1 NAD(P)-binding protein [Cucurbitaria berberidis CBS 394.84]